MNQSEPDNSLASDNFALYTGIAVFFLCNLIVNFPANIYVTWLIVSKGIGSVTSELYALNLAISEIIFCISTIYMTLHFLLGVAVDVGVLLLHFFMTLMSVSRPIFHSCISLERYLAVVHPTTFLRFKPLRYKLAFCLVTWLLVLLFCVMSSLGFATGQEMYHFLVKSLVFLVLMSYFGVHILCVLKQPGPSDGRSHHEGQNLVKRKAFNIIMITLVFTISTELFHLIMFVLLLAQGVMLEATMVTLSVNIISGFITSLLYLHRARKLPCISAS